MSKDLENLLFVAAFALLGWGIQAFKEWFSGKQAPGRPAPPADSRSSERDKEEKMRRFMEALGLPPDQLPPKPVQPETPGDATADRGIASRTGEPDEEAPPLMAPRPPRQHPMGPVPNPWATTSRPSPESDGSSYEERMAARRRELEKLKETRATRKQAPPRPSPSPAAILKEEPEPLFSPLLPEASSLASDLASDLSIVAPASAPQAESPKIAGPLMARLRDPDELRRAFVLKEILGRPKALEGF